MHSTIWPATPGAIIGYRRNGTPIRLIAGGSGEGDDTGTEGQENPGGESGQQDNNSGGDEGDAGSGTSGSRDEQGRFTGRDGGGSDDAARTERTIAAIRADFKDERAKRQAAEKRVADIQAALDADKAERAKQMDALAVAFGLKSGDEPPDPAKLAEELKAAREQARAEIDQRDASIRQSQVELAVLRTAGKNGANGDALLDSRSFMAKVSGLDPAGSDFAGELAEAIKVAVENGPQYKAVPQPAGDGQNGGGERKPPAPSRSGGEHTTPGGNRQWTIADVEAASPAEMVAAQEQGLLVGLGYPPQKKKR